jgi:hypothetical protein
VLAPHAVEMLKSSDIVPGYNAMVDILQEQMPSWIPADKQAAWRQDWTNRLIAQAAKIGTGLNSFADKAKTAIPNAQGKQGTGKQADPASERMKAAEAKEQDFHWKTNILPQTDKHATGQFNKLFAPYDKRLKLDTGAKNAVMQDFAKRMAEKMNFQAVKGQKNPYQKQMERYRGSKNPDPTSVGNYFKVEFDKHAKTVLDGLVNERYGRFLKGAVKTQTTQSSSSMASGSKGPILPKEFAVSTRPADADIDFKHPKFRDLRAANKFPLKSGKVAVLRRG